MFRPIPFLHSYDVTVPYTRHETQSPYFTRVQEGGLHTTPRCSLLPTLRNTIYQASRRHHTFLFFFPKISFSKIFWALSRGPRAFPPFSNSPTPLTYSQIFSRLSTTIRISFFTVLPNGSTPRSYVLLALHQGVPNLWARAIHGPRSPLEAVEHNRHRHPYATTLLLLWLQSKVHGGP